MKVVVQRAGTSSVKVNEKIVGNINSGLVLLVGFTDMFLPSIMVSGNDISQVTQFIIGTLSITQLIYLTETGAVILKSDIPLKLKDLFVLFIVRTLISLPVITIIAKLIFSL